jgi:hypothetical protein
MRFRQLCQGVLLAAVFTLAIVLLLNLADNASVGVKSCLPTLFQLKLLMDFQEWLGCSLATHEDLAGALIGGASALFAAWIAWHAVMRQINVETDQAYDALRVELGPIIDMLDLYWRVVDSSIKNQQWRPNGVALLRALHPRPYDLVRSITPALAEGLDPARRRQFRDLTQRLSALAEIMHGRADEPLWFENVRTMLTHVHVSLRKFDRAATKKFRWRKKTRVDNRSMTQLQDPLVASFERSGNLE